MTTTDQALERIHERRKGMEGVFSHDSNDIQLLLAAYEQLQDDYKLQQTAALDRQAAYEELQERIKTDEQINSAIEKRSSRMTALEKENTEQQGEIERLNNELQGAEHISEECVRRGKLLGDRLLDAPPTG